MEAVAYDTAMILLQMISRPDIHFRSALKDELMTLENFDGVTGRTSFDENGDVKKTLRILQISGEKFVELEPPGGFPAAEGCDTMRKESY